MSNKSESPKDKVVELPKEKAEPTKEKTEEKAPEKTKRSKEQEEQDKLLATHEHRLGYASHTRTVRMIAKGPIFEQDGMQRVGKGQEFFVTPERAAAIPKDLAEQAKEGKEKA